MDVGQEMGGGMIDATAKITGRGVVLLFLWAQCSGKVMTGGIVESSAGRARIRSIDGAVRHLVDAGNIIPTLGVLVDETAAPFFAKGQHVKFYAAA